MKKTISKILLACSTVLFVFSILNISKAQAIECSSNCTNVPGCDISMDCSGLCVERSTSFTCSGTTYKCVDECPEQC